MSIFFDAHLYYMTFISVLLHSCIPIFNINRKAIEETITLQCAVQVF